MRKSVFLLTLFSLIFAGCETEIKTGNQADVSFQLTTVGEFTKPAAVKAEDDIKVDVNDFTLTVEERTSGKQVLYYEAFRDVPSIVSMAPGVYTVRAASPNPKKVAWSQPLYEGSEDVSISAGKTEPVSIECKLINMKVSVVLTESFINEMNPDYLVVVTNNDGTLSWDAAKVAEGTSGYFSVSPLMLDIKATRKDSNQYISHSVTVDKVAAQDHHIFTIGASQTGGLDFENGSGITIDYTVNNREENITIDGLEENPINAVAPEFRSSTVTHGATDVALTTSSLRLVYSTNVQLVSGNDITLNGIACTASASGEVVSVTLPALSATTQYTLVVPAGAVANLDDATKVADAVSITFTTAAEQTEEPDPGPGVDPIQISCPGVETPAVYSIAEVMEAYNEDTFETDFMLDVKATNGIEKLIMTVDSPLLINLLATMEKTYGDLNPVDMAHMTTGQTSFWGGRLVFSGLKSEDVLGKTEFSLDVAPFIPMIAELEEVYTHDMSVEVIDKKGNSKKVGIKITMNE